MNFVSRSGSLVFEAESSHSNGQKLLSHPNPHFACQIIMVSRVRTVVTVVLCFGALLAIIGAGKLALSPRNTLNTSVLSWLRT